MKAVLGLACGLAAAFVWADEDAKHDKDKGRASVTASLEAIKRLAGEWVLTKADKDEADSVVAVYRVIADGNRVMETIFPGSEREMITVYYADGDDLLLTHFSSLGNQPRMRAGRDARAGELSFEFVDASNLKNERDPHLRALKLTYHGADQLKAEWTPLERGHRHSVKTFDRTRVPKR